MTRRMMRGGVAMLCLATMLLGQPAVVEAQRDQVSAASSQPPQHCVVDKSRWSYPTDKEVTQLRTAFECADQDGDKAISFDEFLMFTYLFDVKQPLAQEWEIQKTGPPKRMSDFGNTKFGSAFINSLIMIFATEIGDVSASLRGRN